MNLRSSDTHQNKITISERDIAEMDTLNTLVVNDKEWETFMAIMEAPIVVNKNLVRAFKNFDEICE